MNTLCMLQYSLSTPLLTRQSLIPCPEAAMSSSVLNAARMSHSASGHDPLMGWGSLVTALIAAHLIALVAWIGMVIWNEVKGQKLEKKD